jgi:hypothetical protein
MSNEIRTRHLIVTLPDTAAEEIDSIASDLAVIAIEVASGAHDALFLSAHEARQLAGVLLAHAETISPAADLEA